MPKFNAEKEETHPSYVMVGFSRISGHPGPMFGSSIENHHTFIRLHVARASVQHDLGRDWYHSEHRPIIEVDLSASAFAELLTTMNVASGVPGTMRSFDGKRVEEPKWIKLESKKVRDAFRDDMEQIAEKAKKLQHDVEQLLAKKNLTQADRNLVSEAMRMIVQQIGSDAPFMLKQFEEAAEKVVAAAKAEVDSFMTHAITAAGMKALDMAPQTESAPKNLVGGASGNDE